MEILMTGTGSMWSVSNSASAVINKNISVDFPNGTYRALKRQESDPGDIGHVLITHTHGDHILDVPVWALGKVKFGIPKENPKIYTSRNSVSFLKALITGAFPESLNEDVLSRHFGFITDDEFEIDGLSFRRIPVSHGKIEAYGYMVSDGTYTVSFSGDSCMCESLHEMAKSSDIFICEAAKLQATEMHLGVQAIVDFAHNYPKCAFVTTHMNDEVRTALNERELPENLTVGTDGMRIVIDSCGIMIGESRIS
ncbi:MAG: MBL fold metallo-hydrolase [Lachnospiraceae bacterium]|nr:MBL fold metallo-hydrolase [Lachnospiraceae bacterium]